MHHETLDDLFFRGFVIFLLIFIKKLHIIKIDRKLSLESSCQISGRL